LTITHQGIGLKRDLTTNIKGFLMVFNLSLHRSKEKRFLWIEFQGYKLHLLP